MGLGDSNYSSYMQMPRRLRRQLLDLGAVEFLEHTEADDATPTGLETVVEPWVDRLWPGLNAVLRPAVATLLAPATELVTSEPAVKHPRIPMVGFSCEAASSSSHVTQQRHVEPDTWFPCIDSMRWLTSSLAVKHVLWMRLRGEKKAPKFVAGDALTIRCPNPVIDVESVMARLPVGDRGFVRCSAAHQDHWPLHIPQPVEAFQALSWFVDLGALPSKRLLRALAECCADPADRQSLMDACEISERGKQRFAEMTTKRWGLPELLRAHPSCVCPLATLLALLPPMKPRYYSVAGVGGDFVDLVFTVVRDGAFLGACSNWLLDLGRLQGKVEDNGNGMCIRSVPSKEALLRQLQFVVEDEALVVVVPVRHREPTSFRVPDTLDVPLIMVGPGTGVAPFLAFLQHIERVRSSEKQPAFPHVHLYFGCRHRGHDHLFEPELAHYLDQGILHGLHVAVSREEESSSPHKKYVQHLIEDHGGAIADALVQRRGRIYVCGDARSMAPAVQEALTRVMCSHAKMTAADAATYLDEMKKQGRYCIDVWA